MDSKFQWFKDSPLGIFVHWGVYSAIGRGEWVLHQEKMSLDEYDKHFNDFSAKNYNPEIWAAAAKNAGATYMVLTAKHHDGFCLFDTDSTDRNSVKHGPKRDLIRPYVEACRKYGLKVGIYFSPSDWGFEVFNAGPEKAPQAWDAYIEAVHLQVRELMSNYGTIDLLWYDGAPNFNGTSFLNKDTLKAAELNAMVRSLQPQIIINNRSGHPGDFHTAEQILTPPQDHDRLWEACMTMNLHWGYFPADQCYKHTFSILKDLTGVASAGGHMLLNIGPREDGSIVETELDKLREIGNWMKNCHEAVSGVNRIDISGATYGCTSCKDDFVYIYVHWAHENHKVIIPRCKYQFKKAIMLNNNRELSFEFKNSSLIIDIPDVEGIILPVIKLCRR